MSMRSVVHFNAWMKHRLGCLWLNEVPHKRSRRHASACLDKDPSYKCRSSICGKECPHVL